MAITSKKYKGGDSSYARRDPVDGTSKTMSLNALVTGWQGGNGTLYIYRTLPSNPAVGGTPTYAYSTFEGDWGSLRLGKRDTSGLSGVDRLFPGSQPNGRMVPTHAGVQADLQTIWLDLAIISWYRIGIRDWTSPGTAAPDALMYAYVQGGNVDLIVSKWGLTSGGHYYYHWEIEN